MAKPVRKFGIGAVSLAVFEKKRGDGSTEEFYSLQKSRKLGGEWQNENVLLTREQLGSVVEVIQEALEEESSSGSDRDNEEGSSPSSRRSQ